MPIVLFIEKNGTIKEMKLKEVVPQELYRKASFKTAEGFGVQASWPNADKYNVTLYARKNGRPGSENKYDFPPPVDNELFFGGCILTNQDVYDNYIDLTKSMWERIYEELFGGFDDLGSEDSDSDEDEDKDVPKTKEGYAKDGFIVDDAEEVESETSEESDSDSSDVELEGEEGDDDIDTDDLCEDDEEGEEDVSDSEVEAEDEDEDENDEGDDFYDSDGDGPKQKKKKPVKKAAPPKSVAKKGGKGVVAPPSAAKKRAPAGGVGTRSKAAKKVAPEPAENGGGYLNCSDELEEEAYLDDA